MKITILNAFGYTNKGDAAILLGMLEALKMYFGEDIEVGVESWNYREDQEKLPVSLYPPLWRYHISSKLLKHPQSLTLNLLELCRKAPLLCDIDLFGHPVFSIPLLLKEEKTFLNHLLSSDIIISIGGGFIHDHEGGPAFLRHIYSIKLATMLGKPTMLYAQSVGPFERKSLWEITKEVLNKVDLITTRDFVSKEYLTQNGIKTKILVTADAAFALPDPNTLKGIREKLSLYLQKYTWLSENRLKLGLTVREWKLAPQKRESYISAVISLIDHFARHHDATVTFFPQVMADINLSEYIQKRVRKRSSCYVIKENLHPMVLKGLIGQMDLFVGTRMHSTIFSMSMGVPTISIAYMPKSADLMKRMGLEDFLFFIDRIEPDLLISKAEKLLAEAHRLRGFLKKKTEEMRRLAVENARLAFELATSSKCGRNK